MTMKFTARNFPPPYLGDTAPEFIDDTSMEASKPPHNWPLSHIFYAGLASVISHIFNSQMGVFGVGCRAQIHARLILYTFGI